MTKKISEMSDSEVLEAAGNYGPAIIGKELFERAQKIQKENPDAKFGPAFIDDPAEARKLKKQRAREAAKATESATTTAETPASTTTTPSVPGLTPNVPRAGKKGAVAATSAKATAARRTPAKKKGK